MTGTPADPAAELMKLIRSELASVPIDSWGFFFPCQVAVWRFIEVVRPGVLGPLKARFTEEPIFEGKGAIWFCEELGSSEEYATLLERIMYPITRDAPASVRDAVVKRGFFRDNEIPAIAPEIVARLSQIVTEAVDRAKMAGHVGQAPSSDTTGVASGGPRGSP